MRNALGQDIPLRMVKDIDKMRDALVRDIVAAFEESNLQLAEMKRKSQQDLEAFLKISAERYGEDLGGKKGNITLHSYDGQYKIQRSVTDYMVFDEGLAAAKQLIDDYLTDIMQDSPQAVRLLVDKAFRPNSAGRVSTSAVLSLRTLAINDERWITAMHAISESLKILSSKSYLRVFKKDEQGNWQYISCDFAAL